jgi:tetratricopeptide (TPR) repeat protein
MRTYYTILFMLLAGVVCAQQKRIDSIEGAVLHSLIYAHDGPQGQWTAEMAKMLQESRKTGYSHGIAVALACEAALEKNQTSDFGRTEKLAREALDWYGRTPDKNGITMAYYVLGFALFAQSHFDESVRYFDTARQYAHRSGGTVEEVYLLGLTGEAYRERGDYRRAFDILQECLRLADSLQNGDLLRKQYVMLAEMFVQIEDYEQAHRYFERAYAGSRPEQLDPWNVTVYAELMTHLRRYDSALFYYDKLDSAHLPLPMLRTFLVSKGEYYLFREDYTAALPYFTKSLDYQLRANDRNQVMRCQEDLAKTYVGLHRFPEAFGYAREELFLAKATDARQNIRDGSQLLYRLYDREGQVDSAYYYYHQYNRIKDSVLTDQLKGRFASFGFEQKIRLLDEQKRLDEVCLREEMLSKKLLIAGILILLLFFVIYMGIIHLKRRNEAHRRKRAEDLLEIQRLEGERAQAALQQRARELEIQALRSQMNPHFIFNCLNAINRFILGRETEAASDYLTKFSRLMRMIMNHSRHSTISLAEELEILRLYLDMERLRFKDAFDYRIYVSDEIDIDEVRIPPLLMQPFIENAVWHGLMHKEEPGRLTIHLRADADRLICVIRDNGIGRERAALLKSKSVEKHKSMGMQITAERMALLATAGESKPFFQILDLYDELGKPTGTEVTLTMKAESYD